jgi:hypothetical protein
MTTLLDAVRRYAEIHADTNGVAQTPIPGLTTVRVIAPSGLVYAISRPLVCVVLQGSKHVTMGTPHRISRSCWSLTRRSSRTSPWR